jgi:hypothetical protein
MLKTKKGHCGWGLLGVVGNAENAMGRYGMSYFREIVVVHILIILSRESSGAFDLRSSSNSQSQFAIISSKEKHSITRDKLLLVHKRTPPGSEQMPPRLP